MNDKLVESLKRYADSLPEANSESILESCRNSAGIRGFPHFPDYSDLADELIENHPVVFAGSSRNPEGSSWMRDEVDRAVLEKLLRLAEEKHLRKVIYGKRHRKNFRNLKKGKM